MNEEKGEDGGDGFEQSLATAGKTRRDSASSKKHVKAVCLRCAVLFLAKR